MSSDNPTSGDIQELPVLPLRDVVVYPHMVIPLFVGRERSKVALDQAMKYGKQVVLAYTINGVDVLDAPSAQRTAAGVVFVRELAISPHQKNLSTRPTRCSRSPDVHATP